MQYKAHVQESIILLEKILETKAPADRIISFHFKQNRFIGSKDKASISSIVYDVLRNKSFLEFYLGAFSIEYTPRQYVIAYLRIIKKLSKKEINEIFDGSKYAPKRLTEKLYNFIKEVHNLDTSSIKSFQKCNYPEWIESYLARSFGDKIEENMQAFNSQADLTIRANALKISREELQKELKNENIKTEFTKFSPYGLKVIGKANLFNSKAFKKGLFEVQDEGSQILAILADAKPKQRILDMCCGAGGKLLALGATMNNTGVLLGTDIHEKRLNESKKRIKRSGLSNASIKVISSENDKYLKRQAGKFDTVFVDAPCSGTGTWKRNPDSKWKLQEEFIQELTQTQASILQKASALVKPEGTLLYATCSILKEENDYQIDKFLSDNPNYELVDISIMHPSLTENKTLQLTSLEHGCDGFFAAILKKIS